MEMYHGSFNEFFQARVDKQNVKSTFGSQIYFDLTNYQLPTILNNEEIANVILELREDLRYPTDDKCLKGRSGYNRQWCFYGSSDSRQTCGVNQLERLCSAIIKKQPDRRLLLVALDPLHNDNQSLTQCLLQFYTTGDRLSCKVYQNSASFSNIIRYDSCRAALLTYMLCHIAELLPGSLVHTFGVIINDNCDLMIKEDKIFPTIKICGKSMNLDDLVIENFEINYVECCEQNSFNSVVKVHFHEEMQYLHLIERIIKDGTTLIDRTLVGTRSIFGPQMVFSLHNGTLPLITTKRVFYRGIIEELLWFLRGSTNGNELSEKNVHIWDTNGSKDFLTHVGLGHREVGDLGPIYGFQWRHFGAEYENMHSDYLGKGVDQISRVIKNIKENPHRTDLLVLAWNAKDLPLMALPPCHCLMQFFVQGDELSCKLYQRSADMGLGVPFNIASYAFLTHMIAHVTRLKPAYFIHSLGDAHVYLNHVDSLKTQLERQPRKFPTVRFPRLLDNIEDFTIDDFIVENYNPHSKIIMEMAVRIRKKDGLH